MTRYDNTFGTGVSNGTAMTTGNSGGTAGTAFTQVSTGAGCTQNYTADTFHGGSQGLSFSHASAVTNYFAWLDLAGSAGTKHWAARMYIDASAAPTAEDYLMLFRTGTGATANACTLKLTTGGLLRMFNSGGGTSVLQTGTTITWTAGTKIRFEADVLIAASPTTTNGFFNASWFIGDSLTASGTITSSAFDLGSVPITQVRFGRGATITGTWSGIIEDVAAETVATGFIGPPPTAPPVPVLLQANVARVDLRTSTPGTGGDTITYSIAQTTGPTTTPDEPVDGLFLIVPHSTTALGYDITLTESSGSTAVQSITVPPLSATSAAGHMRIRQRVSGAFV